MIAVVGRTLYFYEHAGIADPSMLSDLIGLHWLLTDPEADPRKIDAPQIIWANENSSGPPQKNGRWFLGRTLLTRESAFASRWLSAVEDAVTVCETTFSQEDWSAYRPAKEFIDVVDPDVAHDQNALSRLIEDYGIRTHKPNKQRKWVHAGDYVAMMVKRRKETEQRGMELWEEKEGKRR